MINNNKQAKMTDNENNTNSIPTTITKYQSNMIDATLQYEFDDFEQATTKNDLIKKFHDVCGVDGSSSTTFTEVFSDPGLINRITEYGDILIGVARKYMLDLLIRNFDEHAERLNFKVDSSEFEPIRKMISSKRDHYLPVQDHYSHLNP